MGRSRKKENGNERKNRREEGVRGGGEGTIEGKMGWGRWNGKENRTEKVRDELNISF